MECLQVQGALKTCFRKEMPLPLPQICFDDNGCSFNPQNVASSDDFFVDQLLDLSNDDEFVDQEDEDIVDENDDDDDKASSAHQLLHHNSLISGVPSLPSSELSVPADDVASLEWLSHFVEDSFSGFSAPFPAAAVVKPESHHSLLSPPRPCFRTPVPVKARSKRTRSGGRVWCLRSPSLTESSSTSTTSSSSSSPASPNFEAEIPAASKKPKRKQPADKARACGAHAQAPRRCSHCGVQKTPQWRTGPLGAKTLCNACGVRFKSGRLLPEYRPACSPTFSSELHSNHHRKVLEMRRNKETTGAPDAAPAPPPLPSF